MQKKNYNQLINENYMRLKTKKKTLDEFKNWKN